MLIIYFVGSEIYQNWKIKIESKSHGFKRIQKECKIKGIKRDSHGELSEVMRSHDESKGVKRSQQELRKCKKSQEELRWVKMRPEELRGVKRS